MNASFTKKLCVALFITVSMASYLHSENIEEINKRAHEYYDKKEFNKAIAEWLLILDIDPSNEEIQKKIESVYDEKHTKDISLQKAKIYMKLANKKIKKNVKHSRSDADKAIKNFVAAYYIDPKNPELQLMKEEMKELEQEIKLEEARQRLSESMKKRYLELLALANQSMEMEKYKEALKFWEEILYIVPLDSVALEGKRQAELAINNRLKYERIRALMESGIALFQEKKYRESRLEFQQALRIDSENRSVINFIEKIDEILNEIANYELRKIQADQFYTSGMENLRKKNFDGAEEDFENVLAIIENYKDAQEKLSSIDRLRKEYDELERVVKLQTIDKEFQKGLLALTNKKYKDAIIAFEAVLILDTGNSLAKRYIQTAKDAVMQIREERVDEDSPYYNIVNSLIVSGKLFFEKGEYIESRRRWEKILDLFPQNRIATEYILKCNLKLNPKSFDEFARKIVQEGRRLFKKKEYRLALNKFEMVKSLSKDYPGINALIASVKKNMVKRVAVDVPASEIERRIKIGINHYSKGGKQNIEKALAEFKWVNKKDPENVSALIYINKIEAQLRVGSSAEVKVAKRLTSKQKRLVKVHYFKGINYYFNNSYNRAISEWRKVLAIDPAHDKAKLNIRKCLVLLKR